MRPPDPARDFELRLLEPEYIGGAVDCYAAVWQDSNAIFNALGATAQEYRPTVVETVERACRDQTGLVLWDKQRGSVAGFGFSHDLVDDLEFEQSKIAAGTPTMQAWGDFLHTSLSYYVERVHGDGPPLRRGQVLYLSVGGIRPYALGQGFLRLIVNLSVTQFAIERGYSSVMGMATHRHGRASVSRAPMRVVAEIDFSTYSDPRIQAIEDPENILVGCAELDAEARAIYRGVVERQSECLEPGRRWKLRPRT